MCPKKVSSPQIIHSNAIPYWCDIISVKTMIIGMQVLQHLVGQITKQKKSA